MVIHPTFIITCSLADLQSVSMALLSSRFPKKVGLSKHLGRYSIFINTFLK